MQYCRFLTHGPRTVLSRNRSIRRPSMRTAVGNEARGAIVWTRTILGAEPLSMQWGPLGNRPPKSWRKSLFSKRLRPSPCMQQNQSVPRWAGSACPRGGRARASGSPRDLASAMVSW